MIHKVKSEIGKNLICRKSASEKLIIQKDNTQKFYFKLPSPAKSYVLRGSVVKGAFNCSISWRKGEKVIRWDVYKDDDNKELFWLIYAPSLADNATIEFENIEDEGVEITNLKFSQELVSGFGEIMDVSEIEDINEPLPPEDFWRLFPVLDLPFKNRKIHMNPLLRQYYDIGFVYELDFGFDVLDKTNEYMNLPVKKDMLGKEMDPAEPYIIAGDIKYNPIMRSHFGYSRCYYPRRQNDYLGLYFFPAYCLSKDEKYLNRAEELLSFFKYSRWEKDGSNRFVQELYPKDYAPNPNWYSGFDYLFDWEWLDGYGYHWKLHEPDHHVNSAIASTFVTAFQLTGKEEYFQYAFDFVYNQFPRYGFHKGVYKGKVYYFTEYNPTGLNEGNPVNDSTDNVVSLAASACATVGYYVKDPVLRGRLFELTRGFLWYLIREYDYDKWFYYDGGENPLNPRRYVSHDMAAMRFAFSALSYLYKAGADIDDLLEKFNEIDKNITKNSKIFENIGHYRLYKFYEGELKKDNKVKFNVIIKVKTDGTKEACFSDMIPEGFDAPEYIDVRLSKIKLPLGNKSEFTIGEDIVYRVRKEQLEKAIKIPFELERGDELKISYDLICTKTFEEVEKSTEAKITAKIFDGSEEYEVEATTSSSVIGNITYSMPLNIKAAINGTNFVSFAAILNYPLSDEINVFLRDSKAPESIEYPG